MSSEPPQPSSGPSATPAPSTLISHLATSLQAIAPPRPLTIQILQSVPRRTTSLFAHSLHHPKNTTIQDLLVLLYAHPLPNELPSQTTHKAAAAAHQASIAVVESSSSSTTTPAGLLISALEVQLFHSPSTSTTTIYIAKVDSSGYTLPSHLPSRPYTRTLISSFLSFYLDRSTRPTTNVDVHLFARSQKQYLFPDSGDLENGKERKKVLGGGGLCRWWKGVFEEAVRKSRSGGEKGEEGDQQGLRMSFVIPGSSVAEADQTLGLSGESSLASQSSSSTSPAPKWTYSLLNLPNDTTLSLPSSSNPSTSPSSLADLIPTFEDDPRTRFLVELSTPPTPNFPIAPTKSKPKPSLLSSFKPSATPTTTTTSDSSPSAETSTSTFTSTSFSANSRTLKQSQIRQTTLSSQDSRQTATKLLSTDHVSESEFWELLAGRQECMLGSTVGFFCVSDFPPLSLEKEKEMREEEEEKERRRRIPTLTFSPPSPTTSSSDLSITADDPSTSVPSPSTTSASTSTTSTSSSSATPSSSSVYLPKPLYTRLYSTLLNQAFATDYLVEVGSQLLNDSIHTLLSKEQMEAADGRVESVEVKEGEGLKRKVNEEREAASVGSAPVVVNSLQPRKKKKVD